MIVGGHGGIKNDLDGEVEEQDTSKKTLVKESSTYRDYVPWSPSITQYTCDIKIDDFPPSDDTEGWSKLYNDLKEVLKMNKSDLHIGSKDLDKIIMSLQISLQKIQKGEASSIPSFRTSTSTRIDGEPYYWHSVINISR